MAPLLWLAALGFEVVRRQDGEAGQVVHSEVRRGDVVLMVASNDDAYVKSPLVGRSTGQGLYLLVDDVDETHARAVQVGSSAISSPRGASRSPCTRAMIEDVLSPD